jgi:S-adenosylmethionine:tRNA ribosyltransferase-isomerase
VRAGEILDFKAEGESDAQLTAEVLSAGAFGQRTLRFAPAPDFYGILNRIGHIPLPPYIRRDNASDAELREDRERYQTVYAHELGSAAAPTAGLHFTPEMVVALKARGVEIQYLTLHVGLGTFQPVRVGTLAEIRLHAERYTLPAATAAALNRALTEGRRVVAVGTTTTRTLEHIAAQDHIAAQGHIATQAGISHVTASTGRIFEPHSGSTSIFLGPGHRFSVVSGLLTNLHLPESTLLMLVAAFATRHPDPERGRLVALAAYEHAIRRRYRFYSYGDCMLLL